MKVTVDTFYAGDGKAYPLPDFNFEVPDTLQDIGCTGVGIDEECRFFMVFKWRSRGRLHTHRVYSLSNESRDALQAAMVLSA